jgi:hypothetical protein
MPKRTPKRKPTEIEYHNCPRCGGALTAKPEWDSEYVLVKSWTCSGEHSWEVLSDAYKLEFRPIAFDNCVKCGAGFPHRTMHRYYESGQTPKTGDERMICDKCFHEARAAWRMDSEKSFARMDIRPIRKPDGTLHYSIGYNIEIRPYPNPFSYGGMWGGGAADSQEELDKAIASFNAQGDELRESGMTKIEVVTHEESAPSVPVKPRRQPKAVAPPQPEPEKERQLVLV